MGKNSQVRVQVRDEGTFSFIKRVFGEYITAKKFVDMPGRLL
jgi:hypothetical protein